MGVVMKLLTGFGCAVSGVGDFYYMTQAEANASMEKYLANSGVRIVFGVIAPHQNFALAKARALEKEGKASCVAKVYNHSTSTPVELWVFQTKYSNGPFKFGKQKYILGITKKKATKKPARRKHVNKRK